MTEGAHLLGASFIVAVFPLRGSEGRGAQPECGHQGMLPPDREREREHQGRGREALISLTTSTLVLGPGWKHLGLVPYSLGLVRILGDEIAKGSSYQRVQPQLHALSAKD